MMSFKEWMGETPQQVAPPAQKKWKATKDQIISAWKTLRADTPIQATPIRYDHQGTSYGEDGVRITGSKEFINSVIPRLKEFLNFETPTTKLQLVYRETESPTKGIGDNKTSFVFYIQVKERGDSVPDAIVPKVATPKIA